MAEEQDTIQVEREDATTDLSNPSETAPSSGKGRGFKRSGAVREEEVKPQDQQQQQQRIPPYGYNIKYYQRPPYVEYFENEAPPKSTDESVGIDNKINLLTQKAQIYLELIQDDNLVGSDKFDGNVEKIINASAITQPIPLKLYTELKNCLAQLGDLYNMKANALVGTLGEYLLAAKDLIDKLGDDIDYDKEKKKLEDEKCTPGESEEECKAKMDAAMTRINELKSKMLSIIKEKKGSLTQFDERKKSIEDLKKYFEKIVFDVDSIDELITEAEEKVNTITEGGEKEMVIKLITELKRLKEKGDQSSKEAEEEKKLEAEAADLQQELEQAAAAKVASETAVKVAEQELKQESGNDGDEETTVVNSNGDDDDGGDDDGGDNQPTEEGSIKKENGVVKSDVDSDQDLNAEIADINRSPATSGSSSEENSNDGHTSGDTISTAGIETERDSPVNIISEVGTEDNVNEAPPGIVEQRVNEIEGQIGDGGTGVVSPQQGGGRRKQSKKRRRKGKRKTKKRR